MRIQSICLVFNYLALLLFAFAFAFASASFAETYTWTDANGKKHYGDTVPPEYQDVAEKMELGEINLISPEDKVRLQNDAAAARLRREDAQKKRKATQQANKPAKQPKKQFKLSREFCRDNTITVKQRTECFNAIEESN